MLGVDDGVEVVGCCAQNGDGVSPGLDWIVSNIASRLYRMTD